MYGLANPSNKVRDKFKKTKLYLAASKGFIRNSCLAEAPSLFFLQLR
jgi:hypothetical protein